MVKTQTVLEAHQLFQGLPSQVYTSYVCLEFSAQKEKERLLYFHNILVFIHNQGSPSDFKAQKESQALQSEKEDVLLWLQRASSYRIKGLVPCSFFHRFHTSVQQSMYFVGLFCDYTHNEN